MPFREIEIILKADNWILIRVHGSHYQYRKVGISHTVIIPNHNGKDLSIGVVKDLEKKRGCEKTRLSFFASPFLYLLCIND